MQGASGPSGTLTTNGIVVFAAVVLTAALANDIARVPLQVADGLDEILLASRSPGVWESFTSAIGSTTYFRPLRFAESKLLFDLSSGHLFAAYKTFHILLLAAAMWLFVRLLRVETFTDAAAALFALLVLTGLHPFVGLVREAFPINHFLQVVVLCLAAANLSRGPSRWWADLCAAGCFAAACLTLESGVLVYVVLLASRAAGFRGVSDRGLAAIGVLCAAYLWFRVDYPGLGLNGIGHRSGFGLERLGPEEIRQRFGTGLSIFSVYNVAVAMLSVLFSEPRAGRFVLVRSWIDGDVPAWMWIAVTSSVITTVVVSGLLWQQRKAKALGPVRPDVVLFAAVLLVNAGLCVAYVKDEVLSVAAVWYALLVYSVLRVAFGDPSRFRMRPVSALTVFLLFAAGTGWAIRSLGVHHVMGKQAFNVHNDWGSVPDSLESRHAWPADPGSQALILRLRRESLEMPVPNPRFVPRWAERVFEDVD